MNVQPVTTVHVGEAFSTWAYYTAMYSSRNLCLLMLNHTDDRELKEAVEHFVDDVEEPQIKRVTEFMSSQGIPFPPVVADQTKADVKQIPPGARFTDIEIANLLVVKIEGLLMLCHTGMVQSIRDDVGQMYLAFQAHLLAQAFTLKKLMHKRGWLMIPPLYQTNTPDH